MVNSWFFRPSSYMKNWQIIKHSQTHLLAYIRPFNKCFTKIYKLFYLICALNMIVSRPDKRYSVPCIPATDKLNVVFAILTVKMFPLSTDLIHKLNKYIHELDKLFNLGTVSILTF